MKKLAILSILSLPAVALAQPAPPSPPAARTSPPAAAPRAPAQPLQVEVTIKSGTDTRSQELVVMVDPQSRSCGHVSEVAGDRRDVVDVCAQGTGESVKLVVDCTTSIAKSSYHASWETAVNRGSRVEVGRPGGVRFALAMK